jgi:hypothetical protein
LAGATEGMEKVIMNRETEKFITVPLNWREEFKKIGMKYGFLRLRNRGGVR